MLVIRYVSPVLDDCYDILTLLHAGPATTEQLPRREVLHGSLRAGRESG